MRCKKLKNCCKLAGILTALMISGCSAGASDISTTEETEVSEETEVKGEAETTGRIKETERLGENETREKTKAPLRQETVDSGSYDGSVTYSSFYGIWYGATKSESEAKNMALGMTDKGFDGRVFVTTDWSNLNSEKWYTITAGVYPSKEAAEAALPNVQAIYSSAYVKYSGDYIGSGNYSNSSNSGNPANISDFIGTFYSNEKPQPNYESKITISKISGGKIYGVYSERGGDHIYDADFSKGVPLNGYEFVVTVREDGDGVDYFDEKFHLTYVNGVPTISIGGLAASYNHYHLKSESSQTENSNLNYDRFVGKYSSLKDYKNEFYNVPNGYVPYLTIDSIKDGKIYGFYYYKYGEEGEGAILEENFKNGVIMNGSDFSVEGSAEYWGWDENNRQSPHKNETYAKSYHLSESNGTVMITDNHGVEYYQINGDPE